MSRNTESSKEHLLQLLADHATVALDSNSATELADLLVLHPEYDESYFELSAAAVDLAMMPPSTESLPERLRNRIVSEACRFLKPEEG